MLAEVLGEPAAEMRNPANALYQCPYTNRECMKSSRTLGVPAPVCSVYRHGDTSRAPICTCPIRFYAADIVGDVIRECWPGTKPDNPVPVYEVGMEKFGKVDLVIADVDTNTKAVRHFLPVELQAVDITGSVLPYYESFLASEQPKKDHPYNFNWANVRKRFISQLIGKGFYCHHWGTRIVAVVQEDLFDTFHAHAPVAEVAMKASNIVFMCYQFKKNANRWDLELTRLAPTTHSNVMNAILYETPPSKAAFEQKIRSRLQ